MLGFSQLSKPIKWQDLLEKGKNGRNAFRAGAKIHFSEKIFWGMGTLRNYQTLAILKRLKQPRSDYNNVNLYVKMTFSLPLPSPLLKLLISDDPSTT